MFCLQTLQKWTYATCEPSDSIIELDWIELSNYWKIPMRDWK